MARDYGTRRTARQRRAAPQQLLVVAVTFLLGYLTASFFDIETVSHWLNTQVLASHEAKPAPIKSVAQNSQLTPKPKFEFYTLLANEKGGGSTQANKAATNSVPSTATSVLASGTQASAITISAKPSSTQELVPVRVVEGKSLASVQVSKGAFLVQVASFKTRQDAEHMKGLLTLKGFDVTVVPVSNAQGNWFRVVIGPYPNRMLAQKVQETIAKTDRIKGVVIPVRG